MTFTNEELDNLERLEKLATPGHWTEVSLDNEYEPDFICAARNNFQHLLAVARDYNATVTALSDERTKNADLTRNAAAVLAEIETLRAELTAVTSQRDHFETQNRAARTETISLKSQIQSQRRNRR